MDASVRMWTLACFSLAILLQVNGALWVPGCHKVVTRPSSLSQSQDIQLIDTSCSSPIPQPPNLLNTSPNVVGLENEIIQTPSKDSSKLTGGYIILPTGIPESPWKSYFVPLLNLTLEQGVNLRELMDNNADAKPQSLANNKSSEDANPGSEDPLLFHLSLIRQHFEKLGRQRTNTHAGKSRRNRISSTTTTMKKIPVEGMNMRTYKF